MAVTAVPEPKEDTYPTRSSLLRRVKNTQDQRSWQEFHEVYAKLITGFAIKAGLTEDEAQEVVQETMIAAAKHLPEFRYDPKVCSFKTWLLNLSAWRVKDQFRKRQQPTAPQYSTSPRDQEEGTCRTATVERVPDGTGGLLETIWEKEWRATLLETALARVKPRVDAKHWQIFDLSALKEWSVKDVVQALSVSAARVYLVRHRITSALAKETKRLERELAAAANRCAEPMRNEKSKRGRTCS